MTTALIAAAAALLGVVLGGFLTHHREHAIWQRDQRAAAYTDLVSLTRYVDGRRTPRDADKFASAYNDLRDRLLIYGTSDVVHGALTLRDAAMKVFEAAPGQARTDAFGEYEDHLAIVVRKIRRDLRLPQA